MTAAMHADIERAVMFNEDQKALSEFITDMKAQYLTSFGLGTPFSKDVGRNRRRSRRGRPYFRERRFFNQELTRAQLEQQVPLDAAETPSTKVLKCLFHIESSFFRFPLILIIS